MKVLDWKLAGHPELTLEFEDKVKSPMSQVRGQFSFVHGNTAASTD